jgi:hypothetical protein
MEKDKGERIQWYLRLLNVDLADDVEEMRAILMQIPDSLRRYFHPDILHLQRSLLDPDTAEQELSKNQEKLQEVKTVLVKFFGKVMNNFDQLKEQANRGDNLLDSMSLSKIEDLRVLGKIRFSADIGVRIKSSPDRKRDPHNKQWKANWAKGYLEKSPLEMAILPEVDKSSFLLGFIEALIGVPLSRVGRCENCTKWFLQHGKKEKKFCSTQCRTRLRGATRRARLKENGGEEYEKELENGRKRAKASYARNTRKKAGPNVKIGTRNAKREVPNGSIS